MKTRTNFISLALVVGSMFISQLSNAQNISGKSSNISVQGTSTMHDWKMSSNSSSFTGTVSGNTITNVKINIPYQNLKSEKGKMMDNKAYKALKESNISFSASTINIGKSNVNGQLTVAGVTKNISLPVTVTKKGNAYVIVGQEKIKMSDYKMDRPGMIGMKAGDEVTVNVSITAQ